MFQTYFRKELKYSRAQVHFSNRIDLFFADPRSCRRHQARRRHSQRKMFGASFLALSFVAPPIAFSATMNHADMHSHKRHADIIAEDFIIQENLVLDLVAVTVAGVSAVPLTYFIASLFGQDKPSAETEELRRLGYGKPSLSGPALEIFSGFGFSKKSGITPSMSYNRAFSELDRDGSGSIGVSELKAALVKGSSKASEAEIQSLLDQVDFSGDGELQLDEFETFWDLFQASCAVVVEPVREKVKTNPADASIVSAVVPAITEDVKKDPVDAFIVGAMRPIKEGVKARKLTDAEERAHRVNQALAEQRKLDAAVPMTPTKEEVNTVEVKARKLAAWMTRRQPGIG